MATLERYTEIQREFAENECLLKTTFDEFVKLAEEKSVQHCRLSFIGKCGHQSSAVYTNYHTRRTGLLCKMCIRENKKMLTDREVYVKQEHLSMKYIINLLSNDFDIIQTDEGCSADLLIRKKPETCDKWLRLQLKTTKCKCHNMYSFQGISAKYKDMIIVCHSLSDNKLWAFPYYDIDLPYKLNISDTSKYNKYLCTYYDFPTRLGQLSTSCNLVCESAGNYQNNKYQRRETEYAKKRMNKLAFLTYIKHNIQYTGTDFTVNEKKVQEKVVGSKRGESLVFQLSRKNGKSEKPRTYRLGENDIYWFHSSFDELFWIVPEIELFTAGLLSKSDETMLPKHFKVNPETYAAHPWLKQYEFNYSYITDDAIAKIKNLFSIL